MLRTSQPTATARPDLSVVIPLHNEEECVAELFERLDAVLRACPLSSEVILVDDGSSDGTVREIRRLLPDYPGFRAVRLRRNFGQTAAMAAGFDHADGSVVVTMDGDLQNPPEDIPKLLTKLDGWQAQGAHHIFKEYPFSNFARALRFVNQAGAVAESQKHHPDICFGWGKARVEIYTHKIDGLTESDFILAARIDAATMNPGSGSSKES